MTDASGSRAQSSLATAAIARLAQRGDTIAIAESLTGGLLTAALVDVPGASRVLYGGVVAYRTPLKKSVLAVDALLLEDVGAVHPRVAEQMATGVLGALMVDGLAATVGVSTTGVAGPDAQDGQPVGTVFIGFSIRGIVSHRVLALTGDRRSIRTAAVYESLLELVRLLG